MHTGGAAANGMMPGYLPTTSSAGGAEGMAAASGLQPPSPAGSNGSSNLQPKELFAASAAADADATSPRSLWGSPGVTTPGCNGFSLFGGSLAGATGGSAIGSSGMSSPVTSPDTRVLLGVGASFSLNDQLHDPPVLDTCKTPDTRGLPRRASLRLWCRCCWEGHS